tara:strand:+ start:4472 stop:5071 length:600 start_codon:yes stop_codon:yes gene_type:complete
MKINNILQEYNYSPEEEDKAQDMRKYIERKSGVLWAEAFWRAWRETGNAEAARRLMPKHYKQMINSSEVNTDQPIEEAMSDAYGMVSAEPKVEGSVEFKQHKNTDKGSVSVEASGDTMQDLADVLKLAGLTLPQDMHKDQPQASADDQEPEQEEILLSPDHEDDKEESPCASADTDVSYETDKEILVNYIKDKLKKSIS